MRSILCLFLALAFVWNSAFGSDKPTETSYTGLLCTKADQAPQKVLGVLVVHKEGEKNPSKTAPLLLVADGPVGIALADLLDKQATITVTGHAEAECFRVTSFTTEGFAKGENSEKDKKDDEGKKDEGKKDETKSGDGPADKKKHKGDGAKDPNKKKKKDQDGKAPGKKDEEPVMIVPQ